MPQNHEVIKQIGETLAKTYGLNFLYCDFSSRFQRKGKQKPSRNRVIHAKILWVYLFQRSERYLRHKTNNLQPQGFQKKEYL